MYNEYTLSSIEETKEEYSDDESHQEAYDKINKKLKGIHINYASI